MAGTNLGNAYVTLMPSAKGMVGQIKSMIGGPAESAGKSAGGLLGSSLVGTVKRAIAAGAVGKFFKDSLLAGADLQQNLGGTEAVFGKFAESVQKTATTAYKNMGLSASDYMATANKMGSLFQGSGVTQERSLKLTTEAMQRAADVASVMGIDTTMAMESIAGAAKGNFTMMDNLGVAMNATTLEAYALEKGVNFKWETASNAEKAELAMQMFMERTQQYAGNFADEAEHTFSGAFAAMTASAKNFMGNLSLGEDIKAPLQQMMSSTYTFLVGNLLPMVGNIIKAIPKVLVEGIKIALEGLPGLVGKITDFINNLADGISGGGGKVTEAMKSIGQTAIEAFKNTDWAGLGKAVIKLIITGIKELGKALGGILKAAGKKAVETFKNIKWGEVGKTIITAIGKGLAAAGKLLLSVFKGLFGSVGKAVGSIKWGNVGKAALNGIKGAFKAVGSIGSTIGSALKKGVEAAKNVNWGEVGKNAITKIGNGFLTLGNFLKDKIGNAFSSAKDFVQNIDWSNVGSKIKDTISNGLQTLGELGGTIKEKLGSAFEAVKEIDWSETFDSAITTILDTWMSLSDKFAEASQEAFEKAKEVITETDWEEVNNSIIEKLSALGELLPEIDWAGMGTTIVESLGTGISSAGDTIGFAFDSLSSSAKQAWEMLDWAGTGRNAVNFISSGVSSIGSTVSSAVSSIASTASSSFSSIPWSSAGTKAISFIRSGISSIGSTIGTAMRTIANNAKTAFTSINWSSIGSNIMKGIKSGITNGAKLIADAAKNAAKRAFEAAKNFLGIESPSKLFRDEVGRQISLGIAAGIDAEAGAVQDSLKTIADTSVSGFPTGLSTNTAGVQSTRTQLGELLRGMTGDTYTFNIYGAEGQDPREIAKEVERILTRQAIQRRAAWA